MTWRRFWLMVMLPAAIAASAASLATARWQQRPANAIRNYHLWYHSNGAATYNNTRWLATPVQKCPLDLWVLQEILSEIKPDVLVETGTYKGGSSSFFASVFDALGRGRVLTIDMEDHPDKPKHPRVTFLHGSSTAPEVIEKVKAAIAPGERVMVALASDHARDHVRKELDLYSPLVTTGSYLIVEGTHLNGNPILPNFGPGPMEAVRDFLDDHEEFERDRVREKFGMTFNPSGYLRRAR